MDLPEESGYHGIANYAYLFNEKEKLTRFLWLQPEQLQGSIDYSVDLETVVQEGCNQAIYRH